MTDLEWFTIVHSSVWISQPVLLCRMQSFGLSADTEQTLKELQQQQQMANEFNCESFLDISVTCRKKTDLAWMYELYHSSLLWIRMYQEQYQYVSAITVNCRNSGNFFSLFWNFERVWRVMFVKLGEVMHFFLLEKKTPLNLICLVEHYLDRMQVSLPSQY